MNTHYNSKYFQDRDILIPHLAETIKNIIISNNLKTILDVGCGTGQLVKYLNNNHFKAIGCDNSIEAVRFARRANGIKKIFQASAVKLPFKKNSFDLVVSISVIEHLTYKDAEKFISEANRVLKKVGYIFLVTPNWATPIRAIQGKKWFAYSDSTHIHYFTPSTLDNLLKKNNFINSIVNFPIQYQKSLEWEFPGLVSQLPLTFKKLFVYLLFSTPFSIIRNSFWYLAQKA